MDDRLAGAPTQAPPSPPPTISDSELAEYERELTDLLGRSYVVATQWLNRSDVRASLSALTLVEEIGEQIASTATILIRGYNERQS